MPFPVNSCAQDRFRSGMPRLRPGTVVPGPGFGVPCFHSSFAPARKPIGRRRKAGFPVPWFRYRETPSLSSVIVTPSQGGYNRRHLRSMMKVLIRHAVIDDAAGIARVRAESWLGAYRGIVPDEFLDAIDVGEWSERQRRNMENVPDDLVSFVAETQGQVVGWAAGGPNREDDPDYSGKLYAIYLLPEHQRRGIGLKLMAATARWLIGEGMDSMIVWVLAENHPARRFYEALGGQYVREHQIEIGGVWLPEVSYGWSDLGTLVGPSVS